MKKDKLEKYLDELSEGTDFDFRISEIKNGEVELYMQGDNKRIEEIDVYLQKDGELYVTSADDGMELCSGERLKQKQKLRQEIIDAFNELY